MIVIPVQATIDLLKKVLVGNLLFLEDIIVIPKKDLKLPEWSLLLSKIL